MTGKGAFMSIGGSGAYVVVGRGLLSCSGRPVCGNSAPPCSVHNHFMPRSRDEEAAFSGFKGKAASLLRASPFSSRFHLWNITPTKISILPFRLRLEFTFNRCKRLKARVLAILNSDANIGYRIAP